MRLYKDVGFGENCLKWSDFLLAFAHTHCMTVAGHTYKSAKMYETAGSKPATIIATRAAPAAPAEMEKEPIDQHKTEERVREGGSESLVAGGGLVTDSEDTWDREEKGTGSL